MVLVLLVVKFIIGLWIIYKLQMNNPRIGEQLFEFEPREVRRLIVGQYELRYEMQGETIYVLRLWHTRERR